MVLITRGQSILIFFPNPWSWALSKIEHDFSNRSVLKLKLPKNHYLQKVLLFNEKKRRILMIFDIVNSLWKSGFGKIYPLVIKTTWVYSVKFIYSEKATKFYKIFTLLLTVCTVVKSKVKISQNFVAFSEYMNFN